MPPRRSNAHGNSSVLLEDNVDEARPTCGVQTRSKGLAPDCPYGVARVPSSPFWIPQGDVSNGEFF